MEFNILIIGILLFIIFSLVQIIGFRFIKIKEIFSWLMKIAFIIGIGGSLIFIIVSILDNNGVFNSLIASVGIFLIYGWLVVLYVFGWFVILESSITIRLLYEIGKNNKGRNKQDILKTYNMNIIIKRRLERLLTLGEISVKNNIYYRNKSKSFFSFRIVLSKFFSWLFPY